MRLTVLASMVRSDFKRVACLTGHVMPRSVLITVVCLCLVSGALGFWLGNRQGQLTETDAIQRAVAHHRETTGGSGESCVARPGDPPVWIVVNCANNGELIQYRLDREARILPAQGPET